MYISRQARLLDKAEPPFLNAGNTSSTTASRHTTMAAPALVLPDEKNKYEDLTGIKVQPGDNPYQALLTACDDDPVREHVVLYTVLYSVLTRQKQIQSLYETHRTLRNAQQRAKFLDPAFQEVLVDPYLLRIENPSIDPAFQDPRHGLVFWARPPEHILQLASHIQHVLQAASPSMFFYIFFIFFMATIHTKIQISG